MTTKKPSFLQNNPLEQVEKEAKQATRSQGKIPSMSGKQLRRSILVLPEMDEEINSLCEQYHVGKLELIRYFLALGIADVKKNGLPVVTKVLATIEMPSWE